MCPGDRERKEKALAGKWVEFFRIRALALCLTSWPETLAQEYHRPSDPIGGALPMDPEPWRYLSSGCPLSSPFFLAHDLSILSGGRTLPSLGLK